MVLNTECSKWPNSGDARKLYILNLQAVNFGFTSVTSNYAGF